jgi:hypothetical protein
MMCILGELEHWLIFDDSNMLALCKQHASTEREYRVQRESTERDLPSLRSGTHLPSTHPSKAKNKKDLSVKKEKKQTAGSKVFEAYSIAYRERYGTDPTRNEKVNSICKQIVGRLGASEAPEVARWYVGSNNSYYVQRGHSLAILLADCEKLRTEWATGRRTTQTRARQQDQLETVGQATRELIAEYEQEEREKNGQN